jgi:hypothetical protein
MLPPPDRTQLRLQRAIRLTALGAQFSITGLAALLAADLASQLGHRHPALIFGAVGGTVGLVVWRSLGRFFRAFG